MKTTADSRIAVLAFDKPFPELFNIVSDITVLEIEGLSSDDFDYKIRESEVELQYQIYFSFNVSTTKTPLLQVTLQLPVNIANHPFQRLTTNKVSTRLKSYFGINAVSLKDLEENEKSMKTGTDLAKATSVVTSFVTTGSSFAFRSLLLMDVIKFLR